MNFHVLKGLVLGAVALAAAWVAPAPAVAGSGCSTIVTGAVLTAAQWNACFAAKQNELGYTPVNKAGDSMTGLLTTVAPTVTTAGFRLNPGVSPTVPTNGDLWTTSAGLFVRISGETVGPLTGPTSGSFAGTSPITVSFPAGVVTYAFDYSVPGTFTGTQTFGVAPVFTDQPGTRTALGLGTAATQNTGTSGATLPFLNGTNAWAAQNSFAARINFRDATPSLAFPVSTALPNATVITYYAQNSPTSAPVFVHQSASNSYGAVQVWMRSACTITAPCAGAGGSTAAEEWHGYVGNGGGGDLNKWAAFVYTETGQLKAGPLVTADILGQQQIGIGDGNAQHVLDMQYPGRTMYSTYSGYTNGYQIRLFNSGFPTTNPPPEDSAAYEYFGINHQSNVVVFDSVAVGGGAVVRNLKFNFGGVNKLDYGVTTAGIWTTSTAIRAGTGTATISAGGLIGTYLAVNNGSTVQAGMGYSSQNWATVNSTGLFGFGNGADLVTASIDSTVSRVSIGLLQIGSGASANAGGSLNLTNLTATGIVTLGTVSSATGQLKLANSASANLTTIQAGNAANTRTYTWPTDFGAAGTFLTDAAGNGTLSWGSPGASGLTVGTSVITSGATTRVLYDNAGVLGEYTISGTGSVAMTGSPTFTGTVATSALTASGTTTISSASFGLSGNISAAAWTTNGIRYKNVAATLTDTSSSGTVATAYTDVWGGNTIAASSAATFTNYFGSYFIDPVAGTNVTLTNKWAIGADSAKFGTSNQVTISNAGVVAVPNSLRVGSGTTTVSAGGIFGGFIVTNQSGTNVTTGQGYNSINWVTVNSTGAFGFGNGADLSSASIDAFLTRAGAANIQHGAATGSGAAVAQTLSVQGSSGNSAAAALFTIAGSDQTGTTTTGGGIKIRGGNGTSAGGTVEIWTSATTTPAVALSVGADKSTTLSGQLFVAAMTQTSAAQSGTVCYNSGTGAVNYDATLGCLTSTMTEKDDWRDLTPKQALAIVLKMQAGSFTYKKGRGLPAGEQIGLSAEQIATIDDRLVGHRPNGDLAGVRYQQASSLYPMAIQQLKAENDNIKAANDNLRAEVEKLKAAR